jgi:hypothetical protein
MQIIEAITDEQRASWLANGFLLMPSFYSHEQIDELDAVTEWMWREKPSSLTVDHNVTGERSRFCDIGARRDGNRFKLNDIYLHSETMRRTLLDRRLTPILAGVLGDDPVLINTLTIDLGTTQGPHVDSLFMTPYTDDALVATWTALEDVMDDAGPLFYYPGSHLIAPHLFSSGLQRIVHEEHGDWKSAIESGLHERKIERQVFLAKKGDVFIWHARLVHGGSEILNPARTRKSLVAHFFTKTDCAYHDMPVRRVGDGYWFNRPEQPVQICGEPLTLSPGTVVRRSYARSKQEVPITIDYVTLQNEGRRYNPREIISVDRSDSLLIRGWAADVEHQRLLQSVLVRVGDDEFVEARSNLGRHDLVRALGGSVFAQAGFLACVPAMMLRTGRNTVALFGLDASAGKLRGYRPATLTIDVR